jgi:hypothetical protein
MPDEAETESVSLGFEPIFYPLTVADFWACKHALVIGLARFQHAVNDSG